MVISHLNFFPAGQIANNIGYVLHEEQDKVLELCDALVWYLNSAGTFIRMPIEVKCYESIHLVSNHQNATKNNQDGPGENFS